MALVHPMFSRVTYTAGTIAICAAGTQFTGIAFQNITDHRQPSTGTAGRNSASLSSFSFTLPAGNRAARDVTDFFPSPSASATTVRATVTAGSPIQMLGMLGDSASGAVTPVVVTSHVIGTNTCNIKNKAAANAAAFFMCPTVHIPRQKNSGTWRLAGGASRSCRSRAG